MGNGSSNKPKSVYYEWEDPSRGGKGQEPTLLRKTRAALKNKLINERVEWGAAGYKPLCAWCDKPIISPPDMHEAIITRGDTAGNEDLQLAIMVEENCVLVHQSCHVMATTKTGQLRSIRQLIHYLGKQRIVDKLETLKPAFRSNTVENALLLVLELEDIHEKEK